MAWFGYPVATQFSGKVPIWKPTHCNTLIISNYISKFLAIYRSNYFQSTPFGIQHIFSMLTIHWSQNAFNLCLLTLANSGVLLAFVFIHLSLIRQLQLSSVGFSLVRKGDQRYREVSGRDRKYYPWELFYNDCKTINFTLPCGMATQSHAQLELRRSLQRHQFHQ